MDRDQTCLLGVAGDVVMMLINGLLAIQGVEKCVGQVESAEFKAGAYHSSTLQLFKLEE